MTADRGGNFAISRESSDKKQGCPIVSDTPLPYLQKTTLLATFGVFTKSKRINSPMQEKYREVVFKNSGTLLIRILLDGLHLVVITEVDLNNAVCQKISFFWQFRPIKVPMRHIKMVNSNLPMPMLVQNYFLGHP